MTGRLGIQFPGRWDFCYRAAYPARLTWPGRGEVWPGFQGKLRGTHEDWRAGLVVVPANRRTENVDDEGEGTEIIEHVGKSSHQPHW